MYGPYLTLFACDKNAPLNVACTAALGHQPIPINSLSPKVNLPPPAHKNAVIYLRMFETVRTITPLSTIDPVI